MTRPAILRTGFEPFGGGWVNPSWHGEQALHGETFAGARVQSMCLPWAFGGDAPDALGAALARQRLGMALAFGRAGRRSEFSVARIAIDVDAAYFPCNVGRRPIDAPAAPGAPEAPYGMPPTKRRRCRLDPGMQATGMRMTTVLKALSWKRIEALEAALSRPRHGRPTRSDRRPGSRPR